MLAELRLRFKFLDFQEMGLLLAYISVDVQLYVYREMSMERFCMTKCEELNVANNILLTVSTVIHAKTETILFDCLEKH